MYIAMHPPVIPVTWFVAQTTLSNSLVLELHAMHLFPALHILHAEVVCVLSKEREVLLDAPVTPMMIVALNSLVLSAKMESVVFEVRKPTVLHADSIVNASVAFVTPPLGEFAVPNLQSTKLAPITVNVLPDFVTVIL